MEFPWRSRPPTGNLCPVCSHLHFPFCIPPPPHYFRPPPPPPDQYFRIPLPPPPPPPQQQASYDPFFDHQGGPSIMPYPPPHPAQIAHRPWNGDPTYSNDYYGNPNSGLDRDTTGQIGTKRMRFDNGSDGHVTSWAEDERRLKLIRDHGAVSNGLDRKYDGESSVSGRSYEPSKFQGIESGYLKEINYSIKQNHGEPQVAYQQSENNRPPHNQNNSVVHNHSYVNSPGSDGYTNLNRPRGNHEIPAYDNSSYQEQRRNFPTDSREFNNQFLQSHATQQHRVKAQSSYYGLSNQNDNMRLMPDPQVFKAQPPLPTSPPPPLPVEPPRYRFSEPVASSASGPGSMFPVALDSSTSFRSPYSMVSEAKTSVSSHYSSKGYPNSSGYYPEETHVLGMASSNTFNGESEGFPPRNQLLDKPKVIDASHILKHPHRANRPDHIVIIMRGLPGSGKSYNAKLLRDIEVENGGTAPRIHSMDEYFMTEVEKVEESEGSRSSGSVRGKKSVARKVMEYCYEPEMEEAYRSSMLKAFKKTLDEGAFPFVIVDDRNLRVADFAQFWATAKRSGYEVYLLEATYKDPAGCAARNVHSFTKNDILKMADQWEEAPSLYMKLDIKSLLHGDDLEENGIEEVDMDTEDGNNISDTSSSEVTNTEKKSRPSEDLNTAGPSTDEQKGNGEEHPVEVVKDLGKSKWSNDLDDDDVHKPKAIRGNSSALSSLTKSYSKKGKSVRWADQIGRIGFSISAGKSTNVSLVIGPGTGYNLNSNPLPEEEKLNKRFTGESRRISIFQDQLRAEHESFKAAFDKRKLRIGVLDADED